MTTEQMIKMWKLFTDKYVRAVQSMTEYIQEAIERTKMDEVTK